jgi:hypothetical protein
VQQWFDARQGIEIVGATTTATPSQISGSVFMPSTAKGVSYLAFAVKDSGGVCEVGLLESSDTLKVTKVVKVDIPLAAACSGASVAGVNGY